MAKGKYENWRSEDGLKLLRAWARDGLTDEQIASKCKIRASTLYDCKNRFPEISEALKKGKEIVDIEVENALLDKAKGFFYTEQVPFKLKQTVYNLAGKKLREIEYVEVVDVERYVPPETAAAFIWLKNRKRDVWKDRPVDDTDSAALKEARKLLGGVDSAF